MKWSVFGLIGVGVLAAMCAAALVVSLRAWGPGGGSSGDSEVSVVEATMNLPRLTLIRPEHVKVTMVPRDRAEKGYPSSPGQVIGRVLSLGVHKGQYFRQEGLIAQGAGFNIASALPAGTRAVPLSLPNAEALPGTLYPGAIVDVLAAFKTRSMTLLKRVHVLAIDDRSMMSGSETKDREGGKATKKGRTLITLLLTSKQAERLHLAKKLATISLALRKPTDATPVESGGVDVEGLLAGGEEDVGAIAGGTDNGQGDGQGDGQGTKVTRKASPRRARYRTVLIIRGSKHEEAKLRVDTGKEAAPKS